jgi:hypothetical protein
VRLGRSLLFGIVLALGGLAASPRPSGAQQVSARFEIASVSDSTFTFAMGAQRWVANRTRGIVVDPAARDALVARFRILSVSDGVVTALVTGQTTVVTTQHFVVMTPPSLPPFYKRTAFWTGAAAGAVLGLILGGAAF